MRLSTRLRREAVSVAKMVMEETGPDSHMHDLKLGARVAIEEWLRRYAKPEVTDPIGLADELLQELDR